MRKAAWNILNCRTFVLGGHRQVCPDGHFERNHYNSCKHRICPQCAFLQIQKWLSKQTERLLACDHYHVILTIPHELNPLWRLNAKIMANLLFRCAYDTLFELLGDPKYLGARPGIMASLHTWTKTLLLHPHVHCLVTGGGITQNRKWVQCKNDYLLPYRVVRDLFRGKVCHAINKALDQNKLVLPEGTRIQQWKNLLNKLGRKKWNARVMDKYAHGRGVVSYLARYVRGGPISNSRIIRVNQDEVVFNVGREKRILMTLKPLEFIQRYLQHVLPEGFIAVRHWGLYSNGARQKDYAVCREILGQPDFEPEETNPDWQTVLESCFPDDIMNYSKCPVCGKNLITAPLWEPLIFYKQKDASADLGAAA